jgi:uncharacterized membrane protein
VRLVKTVVGSRWFHPLLLLLWVAVGAGLRVMRLTAKAPWTDEFSTIVFSLGHTFDTVPLDRAIAIDTLLQPIQPDLNTSIGDVVHHLLTKSNHPPLYFVLAHLWMRLFPPENGLVSMWAARSLPALFGTLSIPAMFGLSFLAFRSRLVAQIAAAMMAVSPFGIFLAQEARHYTLATLFVIASICCLIVAVQGIRQRTLLPIWLGLTWVIVNTLGVATHYFFTFTLCAEVLVLLAVMWRYRKREESFTQTQDGEQTFTLKLPPATPTAVKKTILESTQTLSPPVLSHSHPKTNSQIISRAWWRIACVAAGTVAGSLVWLPALQANYDSELTHWIYDGDPLKRWLEPIGRVLAWLITTLVALPMETTTLPLGVAITSGVVTVLFLLWVLRILWYGFKLERCQPNTCLNLQLLGGLIIGALIVFSGITYTLGADLTLAPRYQFVYFPAAIALVGFALATSWNKSSSEANSIGVHPWRSPANVVRRFTSGGKTAVVLIWLMGLLGGVTVTWNLGYLQSIRPDFLAKVIHNVSDSPVLIATTHQHHGHTGRMMGLAWEFKHHERSGLLTSPKTVSPQFLLAHAELDSQAKNPTITLQETVAQLPRPLDVWLVNFHADVELTQQHCFPVSQRLPKLDSYWYRLYRCPPPELVNQK